MLVAIVDNKLLFNMQNNTNLSNCQFCEKMIKTTNLSFFISFGHFLLLNQSLTLRSRYEVFVVGVYVGASRYSACFAGESRT
jgi:hypothetical protein